MARNRIHNYLADKRAEKAEALLPYDLGDELIGALWLALSEPLDDPQFDDMDEGQKRRIREAGF